MSPTCSKQNTCCVPPHRWHFSLICCWHLLIIHRDAANIWDRECESGQRINQTQRKQPYFFTLLCGNERRYSWAMDLIFQPPTFLQAKTYWLYLRNLQLRRCCWDCFNRSLKKSLNCDWRDKSTMESLYQQKWNRRITVCLRGEEGWLHFKIVIYQMKSKQKDTGNHDFLGFRMCFKVK